MTTETLLKEVDTLMTGRLYMFSHQVIRGSAGIEQRYSVYDADAGEFLAAGAVTAEMLLDELRSALKTKKGM